MKTLYIIASILASSTWAFPGYQHGGAEQLVGVPDISSYGKLTYPKYDLLELGTITKDSLPPAVVHITKEVTVKVPQPYPVKVPHGVPYPVPVAKPYPVVETKIIKVPHPVPYEVIKKVPVPIEVPKPYPVAADELKGAGQASFGGSFGGHGLGGYQQLAQQLGSEHGDTGSYEGYSGGDGQDISSYAGDHGESDQSAGYQTVEQPQQQWSPIDGGEGQQQEEQH